MLIDFFIVTNPMTGELYETDNIDDLLELIKDTETHIGIIKYYLAEIRDLLYKKAEFNEGKTARIQGKEYSCKIELPSKVQWDQKKLSRMHSFYPHGTAVDSLIKIQSYKVDMREYKKLINTTGDDEFNKFKEEMISANLGVCGSPKFTIE